MSVEIIIGIHVLVLLEHVLHHLHLHFQGLSRLPILLLLLVGLLYHNGGTVLGFLCLPLLRLLLLFKLYQLSR